MSYVGGEESFYGQPRQSKVSSYSLFSARNLLYLTIVISILLDFCLVAESTGSIFDLVLDSVIFFLTFVDVGYINLAFLSYLEAI